MAFRGLLRQQSRYFPMIFDLITSVTGTRSWMRSSESGAQIGTLWNANGTRMERKRNAFTNAFRTRFLLGYFWAVLYGLRVTGFFKYNVTRELSHVEIEMRIFTRKFVAIFLVFASVNFFKTLHTFRSS